MNAEPSKPSWYVLYGYPGYEGKLRDNLRKRLGDAGLLDQLYDILIPNREPGRLSLTKNSLAKTVYPILFLGAVFVLVAMSRRAWDVVRQTPGLAGFYGTGNQPLAYPPAGDPFLNRPGTATQAADKAARGRMVRILNGPFRDFRGLVFDVDEYNSRLRVMIEFHQHPTSLDLGFEEVDQA